MRGRGGNAVVEAGERERVCGCISRLGHHMSRAVARALNPYNSSRRVPSL